MIKNPEIVKKFEDDFLRNGEKLSYTQCRRLFDSMWNEAVALGLFPPKEPLEGIEVDLKIARVLHSCLKKSCPG
jgi:hypothetical protein